MRHLSRHITLNCAILDTSVFKNIYHVFENLTAIGLVFGHLKVTFTQEVGHVYS